MIAVSILIKADAFSHPPQSFCFLCSRLCFFPLHLMHISVCNKILFFFNSTSDHLEFLAFLHFIAIHLYILNASHSLYAHLCVHPVCRLWSKQLENIQTLISLSPDSADITGLSRINHTDTCLSVYAVTHTHAHTVVFFFHRLFDFLYSRVNR